MKKHDSQKTVVRRLQMDRTERGDSDPARRAKLILLLAAGTVLVLMVISFVYAAKARAERNRAVAEIEMLKQDNAKLTQWLEERTQEVEALKKQVQKLQSAARPKPKTTQKKKQQSRKKSQRTGRTQR